MKHPNHPSVDQSDRVVPYNLRQSGRTPTELLISTRVRSRLFGIYLMKQVAGGQRFTIASITQEDTLGLRMAEPWSNMKPWLIELPCGMLPLKDK